MRLHKLTASTIALMGYIAAEAQEQSQGTAAAPGESAQFRWKDFPIEESSIMTQARAVYTILRAREAAENGTTMETTAALVAEGDELDRNAGNCRLITRPGSLIRQERCFFESSAEARLSEFQYEMERRETEEALARHFLEVAEYELAFRKEEYQNR